MNTVKLDLSVDEVNLLLAGLGELPAKTSLVLIEKIRAEAVKQLQISTAQQEQPATAE